MKKSVLLSIFVSIFLLSTPIVFSASDSSTHDVTVTLSEIVVIEVTGGNITLTIATASDPGVLPDAETDATTALDWTSNVASGSRAITAALDTAYTAGIVLKVTVTNPAGTNGTNAGQVTLTNSAQNVYTGITNENCTSATLTYEATLSTMIAPISETKTVTYTILDAA